MAQDWLADVRKYAPDADEGVVAAIVRHCGIALQKADSSLVSFADRAELDRVRENYLKKKLGLVDSDERLDEGIAQVGQRMSDTPRKNRVTVYYLLAEAFDKLGLFGGPSSSVGAAGLAGAAGAAGIASVAEAANIPPPEPAVAPQQAYSPPPEEEVPERAAGGLGWLKWLLLALVLLALLIWALKSCSPQEGTPAVTDTPAATDTAVTVETPLVPAVVPTGAGVLAEELDGRPMLKVYFDTAQSAVTNDLAGAATNLKAYADANPAATLAVSGFNDPTGDAAANAELSQARAENVRTALVALGIPAGRIELVRPADTSPDAASNAEARRVDVTVRD